MDNTVPIVLVMAPAIAWQLHFCNTGKHQKKSENKGSLFWADHPHIMGEKPGIRNQSVVRH